MKKKEEEERENAEEEESKENQEREEVEVDVFVPKVSMFIYVNKQGKLEVDLKGVWTARLIRAINLAVIKAYRAVKKTAITKKEE